jgi:hypothetical protein
MLPDLSARLLIGSLLGTLLAMLGAWALAWAYRRAVRRLMSAPLPLRPAAAAPPPTPHRPTPTDAAAGSRYRRAERVLVSRLLLCSMLLGLSLALLWLLLTPDSAAITPRRLLLLGLLHSWPLLPALGLLWRWPRRQLLLALLLWIGVMTALTMSQSTAQQHIDTVLLFIGGTTLPPLLWVMLICTGGAIRALAPWLILPMLLLGLGSMLSLGLLEELARQDTGWLMQLVGTLGAWPTLLLAALLPWLLLAGPLLWLGRRIARHYEQQRSSELIALFVVVWVVEALCAALEQLGSSQLAAFGLLLPPAGIMLFMRLTRAWAPLPPPGQTAPVLLVLRVFRPDNAVQELFDQVVERWRLVGPALLIAGVDLIERTLDAGDLVTFLSGRLHQRFVREPADVAPRLAEFQWQPDPDGRWRVNECYCHDQGWREALARLVEHSDCVLMDLRGFQPGHAGCRHELGVLATAARLQRIVLLTDRHTDTACLAAETAAAPPGRFLRIDCEQWHGRALRRHVLQQLLGG